MCATIIFPTIPCCSCWSVLIFGHSGLSCTRSRRCLHMIVYQRGRVSCKPVVFNGRSSVAVSRYRKRLVSIILSHVWMKNIHSVVGWCWSSKRLRPALAESSFVSGAVFVMCLSWWWTKYMCGFRNRLNFLTSWKDYNFYRDARLLLSIALSLNLDTLFNMSVSR